MKRLLNLVTILSFISINLFSQSLEDKIGQMIMVGFNHKTSSLDTLYADIHQRNLGGVLLFAHNAENPSQLNALTNDIQNRTSFPIFIAIDQEGGLVARLDEQNGYVATYSAYKLGTTYNIEDSTRNQASMMASWLNDGGCNINFAPVVDVNVNPNSPAIGAKRRSFSSNPSEVFQHASWFIDEFKTQNIISTLKHFPGHGSAVNDSHLGFTDVTNTWSDTELIPYRELIDNGYEDNIMSAHIFNRNLDSLYPASLSYNTITKLLRDSLKFNGLVISDEMLMQAITNEYSFDGAIELAINAGIDVLLYSTNIYNNKSLVEHVINIVTEKVNSGKILVSRIDEAYNRILLKKDFINSVENKNSVEVVSNFSISNYPNPFNSTTNIEYSISQSGNVSLIIYDMLGREIVKLVDEYKTKGKYSVPFHARNLSTGVYFQKLELNQNIIIGKMLYLK